MLTTALIDHILARLPTATVGLVGDLFLDRYLDIDPARDEPSVETGKTAYQVTGVRSYPGALGTVLNNLVALGVGRVVPVSVIGDDGEGYELRQALAKLPAVDASQLIVAADRRTPTYTKPMYGTEELNRLDIKNRTRTPTEHVTAVIDRLTVNWSRFDVLLVLDQVSEAECGVITTAVREWIGEKAASDPAKFVLADSRERIWLFRNVCVKPNRQELGRALPALRAAGGAGNGAEARLSAGVAELAVRLGREVFLTDSQAGMIVARDNVPGTTQTGYNLHVPAYPVSGPIDVCGAGDSCSAGIACAMIAGCSPEQAAAFGNLVASITVQQIGTTGTASPAQVRARWQDVNR